MTAHAIAAGVVRLAALVASAGDPLGPVDQDPDAVRTAACKLVAADQQCTPPKPPPSNPPAFEAAWLTALLWLLLGAGLVFLVVIAIRALLGARWSGWRRRAKPAETADDDPVDDLGRVVAVDHSRDPRAWRAEADDHRRAGRWRDALRCRYRALVGDLARRGVIDEIPGRTTGEERRQMAEVAATAHAPFDAAADLFDGAWYGDAEVGERDDDAFRALEEQVLRLTEPGGR